VRALLGGMTSPATLADYLRLFLFRCAYPQNVDFLNVYWRELLSDFPYKTCKSVL
jgi:hypothetical protein